MFAWPVVPRASGEKYWEDKGENGGEGSSGRHRPPIEEKARVHADRWEDTCKTGEIEEGRRLGGRCQ